MSSKGSSGEETSVPVNLESHSVEDSFSTDSNDSSQSLKKRAFSDSEETEESHLTSSDEEKDEAEDHCPICLGEFRQKSFVEPCLHSYCFQCIELWASAHRQCPLCKVEFFSVIYNVAYDTYRRFTFPPLAVKQGTASTQRPYSSFRPQPHRRRPLPQYGPLEVDEEQRLEAGYRKRRLVYKYKLRAVHIGSNNHSGFQPAALQNQTNTERVVAWIRRDLQVLLNDEDVELVKEHVLAIMKKMDMKSEKALELLEPFLGEKNEHFVHELITFARSSLNIHDYDRYVPYNIPQQLDDREHRKIHKMLHRENQNLKKPRNTTTEIRSRGSSSPESEH